MAKIALYLAGGGARGAYQVGVLKAISHILQVKHLPFSMVSGVSIGSINAMILAQYADDFSLGVTTLETIWRQLRCEQIFNSSNYELSKSFFRNIRYLLNKKKHSNFLLDTTPLHHFIDAHINYAKIRENLSSTQLETIEVINLCYETRQTISFYQHAGAPIKDWDCSQHASRPTTIDKEHILGSSALPFFFPTVKIEGLNYGDGCIGLTSPLRGAIHFQADKILILGTRHSNFVTPQKVSHHEISFENILGTMLNGLFADNLDRQIEIIDNMNQIIHLLPFWKKRHVPWRSIETLYLHPSHSISGLVQDEKRATPTLLRGLLNFFGTNLQAADLISFLFFEEEFTSKLIDLGYEDTLIVADQVAQFFAPQRFSKLFT